MELPACALTTPQRAQCRKQTPLTSHNDLKTAAVSAEVTLGRTGSVRNAASTGTSRAAAGSATPAVYSGSVASAQTASTSGSATVIAATDSTGQEGAAGGNYATTLSSAGSWDQSGSSGDFTYTYEVDAPGASTSLVPDASLSYDSGSVDGETATTQAQASWVGDGWTTQDSFVDQAFVPCDDYPEGSAGSVTTTDECYDGPILTLSLNGSSTSIVYDDGHVHLQAVRRQRRDGHPGDRLLQRLGYVRHAYWMVTERDGTKYYFGRNNCPAGPPGTRRRTRWTRAGVLRPLRRPVLRRHRVHPSVCTMAYRWNLDYVTDPHGNAMAYYYNQDTNYYGAERRAPTTSRTSATPTWPHRLRLHRRQRLRHRPRPGRVRHPVPLHVDQRHLRPAATSTHAANYPDVPYDLICASGATCTRAAPSFCSTVRLTSITTEQYPTRPAPTPRRHLRADQTSPPTGDGTAPTLWLSSITAHRRRTPPRAARTSSISLPAVTFAGRHWQNRVDTATYPGLYRFRITRSPPRPAR